MAGTKINSTSGVADGASAIGHELDTITSLATGGAKLLSIKNATVEKFAIDKDGNIITSGGNSTWVALPADGHTGIGAAIYAAVLAGGGTVQLLAGTYVLNDYFAWSSIAPIVIQGMGDRF